MENERRRGLGFIGGILTGVIITSLVVVVGYGVGQIIVEENSISTEVDSSVAISDSGDDIINDTFLKKVNAIEDLIEDAYYLGEVNIDELREGAYNGIVEALGDPYSVYYTSEETEEVFEQTEGIFYGIGAYVQLDTVSGYAMVSGTIKGTPAEEAGLKSGDIFYKVDGEDMAGLDLTQVVLRIKGEEGTVVHLTMIRDGQELELDVVRRKIEYQTVEYQMLEDRIGYIQLMEFDDITVSQFKEALDGIKAENAQGMIIDLRANPGGSLYAVVDIADMLLGKGLVTYIQDKQGHRQEYTSDSSVEIEIPMVVLVDGNSASASELLSGALKDHGVATLVGTTTFGKGIVQNIRVLKDGSSVKLTTSAYYTPNGTNIHGTGIEPDVVVEFDGEAYYGEGFDNQLEKAKEVLKEMLP